jgi:hypothetical protein
MIIIPKTVHQLIEWGMKMQNCIGGYCSNIENGSSIILGITDLNGGILYGIDIEPDLKVLNQFRGKYNQEAPQELQTRICDFLIEKKLLDPSSFRKSEEIILVHELG